jgi:predicted 3-demethylubiquinone-9 3-methyltransferase (glyoxalase superfamily)
MFEGNAEAAMNFYMSLFTDAEMLSIDRYRAGEEGAEGSVKLALFSIVGETIMCIDSPIRHEFGFTPSFSFFVDCDSEDELERLVTALADGGVELMPRANYGFSRQFAWVSDRYGVSWQLNLP